VRDGRFLSEGNFRIDGAPGTGSKILLDFLDSGGAVTGKLLPSGKVKEEIKFPSVGTLTVSMVDAANPFVFVKASDLGLQGNETLEEISSNGELLNKCEEIRAVVAEIMGIAKQEEATRLSPGVPKIALVSPPCSYRIPKGTVESSEVDIIARMTALQKLHKAYAVTGAVCLGAAAKIEGTIVNEIFRDPGGDGDREERGSLETHKGCFGSHCSPIDGWAGLRAGLRTISRNLFQQNKSKEGIVPLYCQSRTLISAVLQFFS